MEIKHAEPHEGLRSRELANRKTTLYRRYLLKNSIVRVHASFAASSS